MQLSDDPFEVQLGDNYELMKDECYENIKRKNVMEQKINELRRTHKMIPGVYSSELRRTHKMIPGVLKVNVCPEASGSSGRSLSMFQWR